MKHAYLTDIAWKRSLQACTDSLVDLYASLFITGEDSNKSLPRNPKILFISLGHLGDALLLSYIFPLVKQRYPGCAIDVLTASWCVPVLKNNPYIRTIHCFDHLRTNRSKRSWWKKYRLHRSAFHQVLRDLRAQAYDVSIEGRVHYPNGNLIAYRGNVHRRIGFGSGGCGGLLTTEISLPESGSYHLLQAIIKEIECIGIHATIEEIQPYLTISPDYSNKACDKGSGTGYILFHPECGAKKKELTQAFVEKLLNTLLDASPFHLIICGVLPETSEFADSFCRTFPKSAPRITNLAGKLSLDEFFKCSEQAAAAVTVDSFAAHFCAIACPVFSIFKNGSGALYFPLSPKKTIVVHNSPNSSRIRICDTIESHYMTDVESEQTLKILTDFIGKVEKKGHI